MDTMNGKFSQSGIRNIWMNPTDSYLIINEKLKVTKNHIKRIRPGFGISPKYYSKIIGKTLVNDIVKGQYIKWEDLK